MEKKNKHLQLNKFMETRICGKCKATMTLDNFNFKRTESRHAAWCKSCLYAYQHKRWKDRKQQAINLFGGKCASCGYDRNYAALEFHHLDSNAKDMDWSKLRRQAWPSIIEELQKCTLLCANCHREAHNPQAFTKEMAECNPILQTKVCPTGKCKICQCEVYGTQYCSRTCSAVARRHVKRPKKEELQELMTHTSMVDLGRKYGVSDNAIRKWAKSYKIPLPRLERGTNL